MCAGGHVFGWWFSFGVQPADSGWGDVYLGIRKLCRNGIRANIGRLYLCVAWPMRDR
jgi:hypothetical protein